MKQREENLIQELHNNNEVDMETLDCKRILNVH